MTVHAYEISVYLSANANPRSSGFGDEVEKARGRARAALRQLGGDPLPAETVGFALDRDRNAVVIVWRSETIPPEDPRLPAIVRAQAAELSFATSFAVRYHVCGNGVGRRCQPWRRLFEESL